MLITSSTNLETLYKQPSIWRHAGLRDTILMAERVYKISFLIRLARTLISD